MPASEYEERARRLITQRCLIATDIDKTVLIQGQGHSTERKEFLATIAPQMLIAARNGTNIALLTGNSMHELSSRFLKGLIEHLCHTNYIGLLNQFHFFCNSGGIYAHFSDQNELLRPLLTQPDAEDGATGNIFDAITVNVEGKLSIRPCFIDPLYIERTMIPDDDVPRIRRILEEAGQNYLDDLNTNVGAYSADYDLGRVMCDDQFVAPAVDIRPVEYGPGEHPRQASVQITLKPVLSFRHARDPLRLVGKDLRSKHIELIQAALDQNGFGHYMARPGGTSSIDVTLAKLDKAYGLEFLIDRLNLQGNPRLGQKFGSNAIYFGDEVIVGGGNDYPVTRIPGLLVFAVNFERELIPLLSHVFVPSAILVGPDATAEVLSDFNKCASRLLREFTRRCECGEPQPKTKTALEALKKEIFGTRIAEKIIALKDADHHSVDDWQILHAFVTLMCRKDPAARQWLTILINELDAIMIQLATNAGPVQPALGTSHPDR
ncbi:MAG TPA: hypothetical protein VFZ44_20575 [Pyrinomonadaceae bacterium]